MVCHCDCYLHSESWPVTPRTANSKQIWCNCLVLGRVAIPVFFAASQQKHTYDNMMCILTVCHMIHMQIDRRINEYINHHKSKTDISIHTAASMTPICVTLQVPVVLRSARRRWRLPDSSRWKRSWTANAGSRCRRQFHPLTANICRCWTWSWLINWTWHLKLKATDFSQKSRIDCDHVFLVGTFKRN